MRPGDPNSHAHLGAALRDVGMYADAVAQFQEVARLRPEEPGGLQEIVATHLAAGNLEGAMASFSDLKGKFENGAAGFKLQVAEFAMRGIEAARKSGDVAKAKKIRAWWVERGFPEAGLFDVKVVVTWDAMSDVDLDVTDPAGETVTDEGKGGVGFFVIEDGSAKVSVQGEERGRLGPGDYFGEIALIAESPRTATIVAESDLRCLGMTFWDFRPLVEEICAIVDSIGPADLQRVARQYPSALVTGDVPALLGVVDAVIVASPAATHATVARQAIDAGKPVLVEKPFALNARDAEAVAVFARDIGRAPQVTDYNSSLDPSSLVFASGLNFRPDGAFPPLAEDATALNPAREPQIFLTQIPASSSNTFIRLTTTPAGPRAASCRTCCGRRGTADGTARWTW